MENLYESGKYLEATKTWHAEDAPWKAAQIKALIDRNRLQPTSIVEIGCGSGAILHELSTLPDLRDVRFEGYDISPQAIGIARRRDNERLKFVQGDLLACDKPDGFDMLLAIDVFEHVPDYMGFLEKCRMRARYKVYHVPLDLHVSSVMRNAFVASRRTIGHIHYFTAESAIETLKDTGHEILDCVFTQVATGLFKQHPSVKKAVANVPRWLLSRVSVPLAARMFGGYSLLVLTT